MYINYFHQLLFKKLVKDNVFKKLAMFNRYMAYDKFCFRFYSNEKEIMYYIVVCVKLIIRLARSGSFHAYKRTNLYIIIAYNIIMCKIWVDE